LTSHYARCTIEAPFASVFESLRQGFGNVYSRQFSFSNGRNVGVILGEQYFFRVNSDVAVAVILQTADKDTTVLEIISCAGGTGMLEVSYAAHKAYVSDVMKYLKSKKFTVKVEEEVPYYSSRP
jgi:hypothetical protein